MSFKKPLVLPILWNTDNAHELKQLGLESNDDPVIKEFTFLNIDHLHKTKYGKDNIPCVCVTSGGYEYLCELDYDHIMDSIIERL